MAERLGSLSALYPNGDRNSEQDFVWAVVWGIHGVGALAVGSVDEVAEFLEEAMRTWGEGERC